MQINFIVWNPLPDKNPKWHYWLLILILNRFIIPPDFPPRISVHKFYAISLVILSAVGLIIGFNLIYFL